MCSCRILVAGAPDIFDKACEQQRQRLRYKLRDKARSDEFARRQRGGISLVTLQHFEGRFHLAFRSRTELLPRIFRETRTALIRDSLLYFLTSLKDPLSEWGSMTTKSESRSGNLRSEVRCQL